MKYILSKNHIIINKRLLKSNDWFYLFIFGLRCKQEALTQSQADTSKSYIMTKKKKRTKEILVYS